MILKSKLSKDKYKTCDVKGNLTGDVDNLDPVFAGRLAYFAKVYKIKIQITDGYRSISDQKIMWQRYKRGEVPSCAKVGTSWHGFSLAIDTSTQPLRGMDNSQLAKFGIAKTIKSEDWHIQPIETLGQTDRKKFAPIDMIPVVKKKFAISDSTIEFLSKYKYAQSLFEALVDGRSDFSETTINYLKTYKYYSVLAEKFKIK